MTDIKYKIGDTVVCSVIYHPSYGKYVIKNERVTTPEYREIRVKIIGLPFRKRNCGNSENSYTVLIKNSTCDLDCWTVFRDSDMGHRKIPSRYIGKKAAFVSARYIKKLISTKTPKRCKLCFG